MGARSGVGASSVASFAPVPGSMRRIDELLRDRQQLAVVAKTPGNPGTLPGTAARFAGRAPDLRLVGEPAQEDLLPSGLDGAVASGAGAISRERLPSGLHTIVVAP